jgi:hypothetical protein
MAKAERTAPRWVAWAAGSALVVGAWFVALGTPSEDEIQAAMTVTAAVGEEAVGRNLAATVTDIRRTAELSAGAWSAEGNWVVVDLDVAAVASEDLVSLRHADLIVDGVRFSASERPESLRQEPLSAGVARGGGLAFELPADLHSGQASLELALASDTRLDSLIVVPFELEAIPAIDRDELPETGWARP